MRRPSANVIGIALCLVVAVGIVVVGPSIFGRTSKMDEIMRETDSRAPRITSDGKPTLKKL
jgi:hypothetical protein